MSGIEFGFPPARNEARERMGDAVFEGMQEESRISTTRSVIAAGADPVVVPIYHSSTYRLSSVQQWNERNHGDNYIYQRCGNPTVENVEVLLREIEGGAASTLYNSGLAAVSAVFLEFLSAGDHLICMTPLYSGTLSFLNETLVRFGVEITFVSLNTKDFAGDVKRRIRKNTKLIYLEVIANPTMEVPDIEGVVAVAKEHEIRTCVDATFASPYLFKPLRMGVDLSLHSCTKYIGGHTDVIAGCVTAARKEDWARLKQQQLTTGSTLPPMEAAMISRGLKTLPLRMERISSNALAIAQHLSTHPKVASVYYPGLPSHPGHSLLARHMKAFAGMIAFDVGTFDGAVKMVESLRLITLAVSLGGTESLVEHPASMSHGKQLLRAGGDQHSVADGLIRFSVGVEAAADLIADLDRALELI